jgi:hypothetical protein
MKTNISISIFFSALCFTAGSNMMAQPQVSLYTDAGQTNVSDGLFVKTAGLVYYQLGKYAAGSGIQLDLIGNNKNVLSGYNFKISRNCLVKNIPLEVQSFFVLTPISDILRETNWGFLLNTKRNHISISAGTNFRTIAFTKRVVGNEEPGPKDKIHENWNLMYAFSYYLKSLDNPWNISFTITDIDNFIITQESNPVINLRASYQISTPLNLFAESWYKSAGALNLQNNYFGCFFRIGMIWKIN